MANDILQEILEWSNERPGWQRDTLRRLFTAGEINSDDLDDLVDLCKTAHGLSDHRKPDVLGKQHLAIKDTGDEAVSLLSVTHKGGVNALAANQTVTLGSNLTVVYGPNAAGKSGYTRILKLACRSRVITPILSNVLSGAKPLKPQVIIRFRKGKDEATPPWTSNTTTSDALTAVSVFDAQCVPVYLRGKNDVAFRPFSLDVFDKLSAACANIRSRLDTEYARLNATAPRLPTLSEGTRAQSVVASLTSLTKVETVRGLATLSDEEQKRLKDLRDQQRDLQASDPKQRARELTLKADRIDSVARHVIGLTDVLGHSSLDSLRTAAGARSVARKTLAVLRETTLTSGLLSGTGDETWRKMWEAAGVFSKVACPGLDFPVITADARCPLCQQVLGRDAATRLPSVPM